MGKRVITGVVFLAVVLVGALALFGPLTTGACGCQPPEVTVENETETLTAGATTDVSVRVVMHTDTPVDGGLVALTGGTAELEQFHTTPIGEGGWAVFEDVSPQLDRNRTTGTLQVQVLDVEDGHFSDDRDNPSIRVVRRG